MVATFWIYRLQLQAMRQAATGQNILSLVNFLQASHVRDAPTVVRKRLKTKPLEQWTEDERHAASTVCATYDVAAILIFQQRLVPPEPFTSNWAPSIRDCFDVCRPFIAEMQRPENSGPHYWNDFVLLRKAVGG